MVWGCNGPRRGPPTLGWELLSACLEPPGCISGHRWWWCTKQEAIARSDLLVCLTHLTVPNAFHSITQFVSNCYASWCNLYRLLLTTQRLEVKNRAWPKLHVRALGGEFRCQVVVVFFRVTTFKLCS